MGDLFGENETSGWPAVYDTASTQQDADFPRPFSRKSTHASKWNNMATGILNLQKNVPYVVDVAARATGGAGTQASPWTGWESTFGWTANRVYWFRGGYFQTGGNLPAITVSGVRIWGAGRGITTINRTAIPSSGSLAGLFTIRASNVEIAHLTIQGAGSFGSTPGGNGKGIYGNAAPDLYAHDIEAMNCEAEAIYTDGDSPRTRFEGNYVHDNAMVGLNINSSAATSRESRIERNVSINNSGSAVLATAQSVKVVGNYVRNPNFTGSDHIVLDYGAMDAAHRATIEVLDNVIEDSDTSTSSVSPLHLWGGAGYIAARIAGNIVRRNQTGNDGTGGPIFIDNPTSGDIVVEKNLISENGVAAVHNAPAISIEGASATARIVVRHNYIRAGSANQQERGIRITASVPAANNIIIGPNYIDQDVGTPYVFTVAPSIIGSEIPVIATASLPAAATAMDGRAIIEDGGAGDRNLMIYAGGQRFRIDGGVAV